MSKGNYKTRVKLARALKNGNLTKSQLIDRFDQQGITSREFIDEFIENIESASDMELEEIDASKPGFWDSIANWFNSNAEAGH